MNVYQMEQMLGASSGILINLLSYVFAGVMGSVILSYGIRWFIFVKAGQKGWKALIPFYSDYINYKIAWDGRIYLALLLGSIAGAVLGTVCGWIHPALGGVVSFVLNAAVAGAYAIAGMILQFKMARAFGRNDYFAVGLYFLGNVFTAILAFGDAKYQGPQGKDGIGVPKFVDDLGQRATAAASAAANAAAQQFQQRAAQHQPQPVQETVQQVYQPQQQPYQPGYPSAPQQGYQTQQPVYPSRQIYQAAPQQPAYPQEAQQNMPQRPGRRAMRNLDSEQ